MDVYTEKQQCEKLKHLDWQYKTSADSPLHHDNRCPIHKVRRDYG